MTSLTPRGPSFVEEASQVVTAERTVDASPEEVWAVFADNARWPEWFPAAKACRTTSDQTEGVGATRWIHFDLFKVNERFVAWDPPHRWAHTLLDANLPSLVSVVEEAVMEPAGEGRTRVTYTLAADLAPYLRPLAPILRWRLGSLFRKGLAGIDGRVAALRSGSV